MTEIATLPTIETAMSKVGLALADSTAIAERFAPHFVAFRGLAEQAQAVGENEPKKARALRLELKAVRVESEKTRKALKEDSLRRGQAIDGLQKVLEHALVPVETAMEEIEKAEERREAARKAALAEERRAALLPYTDPTHYNLGDMPEAQFVQLLAGAKAAKEAAEEAARKAEAERVAREKAEAEAKAKKEAEDRAERERLAAENARLAAEKAAAEAKAKAEREAAEKEAARIKAEADAKLESERKAAAEAAAKAKAEADAREAAAREEARKAKEAADRLAAEKAAAEKAEAERKAAEEAAARAAAAAPDREKLAAFAAAVRALPVPTLTSPAGVALSGLLAEQVAKFAGWVEKESGKL